jgi:acetolactate synthase I/II/III large subunit
MVRQVKSVFPEARATGPREQTAAELLVRCLENEGVEYVYGIPGEETLDVNEAIEHSESVRFIPVRHEESAAFMADAYGRYTGRPGVCLSTLGPGATNLTTGVADAYLDRAPMVALTGQVGVQQVHKETHQYIDVVDMLRPITKWNATVGDPRVVPETVRKAFAVAAAEKPGATHLELPEDIMARPAGGTPLPRVAASPAQPAYESLDCAARLLQAARRPVMLVGNGVVRTRSAEALRLLCEQTGLHVITTFMGKGVIDSRDEHYLFTAGLRGQDYPQGLMGKVDLVVTVGYDLVEWSPEAWNPDGKLRIVCIDTAPADIDAHFVPQVELVGDIGGILTQLGEMLSVSPPAAYEMPPYHEALASVLDVGGDDDRPIKPQRVLHDLRAVMGPHDLLVSDVGAHKLWIARLWQAYEPNTVWISNGFAAMGFALPAAVSGALAARGRHKVVTVMGDGGFLMSAHELETAVRLRVPLVCVIWTDGSYGLIEMHQERRFGHVTGTRFGNPDFASLARSFGADGLRVERASELAPALERALRADRPVVVDVAIDYSENRKLGIDLWRLAPRFVTGTV